MRCITVELYIRENIWLSMLSYVHQPVKCKEADQGDNVYVFTVASKRYKCQFSISIVGKMSQ